MAEKPQDTLQIDTSWYQRREGLPLRLAAGGVVVRSHDGRALVALAHARGEQRYFLPKGGVEEGETIEQAALREVAEETGLTELSLLRELGVRERMNLQKTRWSRTHYFLMTTTQCTGQPTGAEHRFEPPHWFPPDALGPMYWPEQRALILDNAELIREAVGRV